jgi:hypothetical protein
MSSDIPALPNTIAVATTPFRGRYPNDTRSAKKSGLDGRTKIARRSKNLFHAITARLGGPTDALIVADCKALCELKCLAERARARLLETEDRSSTELGRLEFLIRHAEARLGLKPGTAAAESAGSWEDLFSENDEQTAGDTEQGAAP